VPDKRPHLSPISTPTLKSAKLSIAIASTALALGAVAGTVAAAPASTTNRPAAAGAPAQAPAASAGQLFQSGPVTEVPAAGAIQSGQQIQLVSARAVQVRRHHLTPRQIARKLLRRDHWSWRQFKYLNRLWDRESGWNVYASNPYSGAYGIPQAVPGSKMASAGRYWRTSAWTQIRWGLRYIRDVYGSPHRAWDHELSTGWY
jgi:hypothetical protein